MSTLYLGKINLSKADKTKIFEGNQGKWIDVTIWVNDKPDNYGNHMSIEQSTTKGEDKIYLGNAKEWKKEEKREESNPGRTTDEPSNDRLPF